MSKRLIFAGVAVFAALIVMLLLAYGFVSLGTGKVQDQHNVQIWHSFYGKDQIDFIHLVSEFNETTGLDNGVFVQTQDFLSCSDLEDSLYDSARGVANSKELPDLFIAEASFVNEVSNISKVARLNAYLKLEDFDKIELHEETKSVVSKTSLNMLPLYTDSHKLYVRKDAFDDFSAQSGFTKDDLKTWERIYECAEKYYEMTDAKTPDTSNDGLAFVGVSDFARYMRVAGKRAGAEVFEAAHGTGNEEKTYMNLSDASLKNAWYIYYKGMVSSVFIPSRMYAYNDLVTGEAVCYVGSATDEATIKTLKDTIGEYFTMDYPAHEGETLNMCEVFGVSMISKSAHNDEYAALFVKWLSDNKSKMPTAQIKESGDVFVNTPFVGEYEAKKVLKNSLGAVVDQDKKTAADLKQVGNTNVFVFNFLRPDQKYSLWLSTAKKAFQDKGFTAF